jgi:hypothetical protein
MPVAVFLAFAEICFGQSTWKMVGPMPLPVHSLSSVVYGNGRFVATGGYGAIITSNDGTTWAISKPDSTNNFGCVFSESIRSVAYGSGQFAAVGYQQTVCPTVITVNVAVVLWTSSDGMAWGETDLTAINPFPYYSITYGRDQFVAVGVKGKILTFSSDIPYTIINPCTTETLWSVTYGDGKFVAVGSGGAILTSPNGMDWTVNNSGTNSNLPSVAFGNGRFVAVSDSGKFLTSSDAVNWSSNTSGLMNGIRSLTYCFGRFIAVGDSGKILTSADGMAWESKNTGTTTTFSSAAYGNGQFVAVGGDAIFTSKTDDTTIILKQSIVAKSANSLRIAVGNNHLTSIVSNAADRSRLKVALFTVAGKRIFNGVTRPQNGILTIPTAGLPSAEYFLSITDGAIAWSSLFVIQ